jgi:hypothetical protein
MSSDAETDPMQRGSWLRTLRELARADDAARDGATTHTSTPSLLLDYESFLQHQRVYDDLKHIDYKYIYFPGDDVLMEQQKSLGKGGVCWDAAFILGEYLIQTNGIPSKAALQPIKNILELGSGTGLCGIMLAKALDAHVCLTDLEPLLPLLRRNVARNFSSDTSIGLGITDTKADNLLDASDDPGLPMEKSSKGTVSVQTLDWECEQDIRKCREGTKFDLIVGADIVATLYDPVALAHCVYDLDCDRVVISFKERLSSIHRTFEAAMAQYFGSVEICAPTNCRNRNPDVQILVATGRMQADRGSL